MAWRNYKKSILHDPINLDNTMSENVRDIRAVENWRVKLAASVPIQADVKIQRGIFQGDSLSTQLFALGMVSLNYILRKGKGRYKFTKSQQKLNHLLYMDDIKIYAMNEK